MDTAPLKPFAQQMRVALRQGVAQRLRYWGIAPDGSVTAEPESIDGGYIFRDDVYSDTSVPRKWRALKSAVGRSSVDAVVEEAAATWFNRLVAIRILELNDYEKTMLGHARAAHEPALLHRARQGLMTFLDESDQQTVKQALLQSHDDTAFRTLLVGYCTSHSLLNNVFGRLNDYTSLLLPTNLLQPEGVMEQIATTEALTEDTAAQVELIGWLYQFYISEKKDAVYDKSGKFEPEDIPAATQIFTPRWIVRYLVENTLGTQWLQAEPDSSLRNEMDYLVEGDPAAYASGQTGVQQTGFQGDAQAVPESNGASEPQGEMFADGATGAAGDMDTLAAWDGRDLEDLVLFDPAVGSGHILVVAFDLLMVMYRERGYTDRQAVERILTHNLKGLDLDRRAVQLARFALLMKAAQYNRRVLDRTDLHTNVYPMPTPRSFSPRDLRAYFGDDIADAHGAEIKEALDLITEHGQNVGSALQFNLSDEARSAIADRLAYWADRDAAALDFGKQDLVPALHRYLQPLLLMTGTYPAVAANPPYASSRNINKPLKNYLKEHYPRAKKDLFATFMEVLPDRTVPGGRFAFITPPSWMFLSSYEDLRTHYIDDYFFDSLLHLSRGIFGADFGSVATAVQKASQQGRTGTYFRLIERTFQEFHAHHLHDLFRRVMDDPDFRYDFSTYDKDGSIPETSDPDGQQLYYPSVNQRDFEKIPGAPIAYWIGETELSLFEENKLLSGVAKIRKGITTTDNKRFLKVWYEVSSGSISPFGGDRWVPYEKGGGKRKWFGLRNFLILWEDDGAVLKKMRDSKNGSNPVLTSLNLIDEESFTYSTLSSSGISCRYSPSGALFDNKGSCVFSDRVFNVGAYLNSVVAERIFEFISPGMSYQPGEVRSLPYLSRHEKEDDVEALARECVFVSKRDYDSRETSWDFTQHPLIQQNAPTLGAAYTAWQVQATDDFLQLHTNEEELNDLFIDLYGLQDELSPRVALDDITILEDELDWDAVDTLDAERDRLSDDELRARFLEDAPSEALFKMEVPIRQLLSYGIGVMLGRYRLGHDGLHIAHPNPSSDELAPYEVPVPLCGSELEGTTPFEIDDNAIVPLMGTDSPFSDDAVYRMREIVRLIWGEDTLTENLNVINRALSIGRSRGLKRDYEKTMEEWLVGDFYDYHKKQYSVPYYGKKPIYWLFQSPEGHFQVLAYMHRMTKYTAQQVRTYLNTYQQHVRREKEALEAQGEDTLSGSAAKRLDRLRAAEDDCRAYDDILQNVAEQRIEIDLDDGVQNNYPKFGDALADL